MRNIRYIFFGFLFCIGTTAIAQNKLSDDPDVLFKAGDYVEALDLFLKLEKAKPEDTELQYKIGVCYLNIHDDKSRAAPYFAKCHNAGYGGRQTSLLLGQALFFKYDFINAKFMFEEFAEGATGKQKETAQLWLSYLKNAKELVKHPVHVRFENLGKEVNTQWADYYPFVTENEGTLYFTSRRKASMGDGISSMGYYSADVFYSKVTNGQWSKAKNMGPAFNTPEDEQCVGLSADGKKMMLYTFHDVSGADLFSAEYPERGRAFTKPQHLPEPINSKEGEYEGCFGPDGNSIYFVSDREGGTGQTDIYICRRLPNGNWSRPQNLGTSINTEHKEAFPQISKDGKTLYFSSQGHNSMGGFDVFKSTFNEATGTWNQAVNIGYPLNTTDDDMMFTSAANGRDGYISAWRKGGFGSLDIYKVIFEDVEPPLTAVRGAVNSFDYKHKENKDVQISIVDLTSKKEIDSKNVNPLTSRYIFVVPPGKYRIDIHCKGYQDLSNEFFVYDKSDFSIEKNLDFTLIPTGYSNSKNVGPVKKKAK